MKDERDKTDKMIGSQIRARGITDSQLLNALKRIPRHIFLQDAEGLNPYGDHPVSIGYGQTMSQPYIVAFMTEKLALQGTEKVLEIGTGSGYQTAVLAELSAQVFTVERIEALMRRARMSLSRLEYKNVCFRVGDGSLGWKDKAPFDRIIVTAAVPSVPSSLSSQLADKGILVAPVGDYRKYQVLSILHRFGDKIEFSESIGCRFVPLLGEEAF